MPNGNLSEICYVVPEVYTAAVAGVARRGQVVLARPVVPEQTTGFRAVERMVAKHMLAQPSKENIVTRIPVEKVHGSDASRIAEETQALTDQIRQLAFHLFESRGSSDGRDLDDWLTAERQLVLKAEPEMMERNGRFEIHLPVAGCNPEDIRVTALPASLVIQSKGDKKLLKTIDLPDRIDVDKTVARVDRGVIYVTAVRQQAPAPV